MDKTCLGVVIPVYNGEKYIKETIRSVLSQPCKDVIVVVVNDGSTDRSEDIVFKEKDRYHNLFYISQRNQGVSAARNAGIDFLLDKGISYIGFLDADDIWLPGFYTDELRNIIHAGKKDVYQFAIYYGNNNLTRLRSHSSEPFDEGNGKINRYDRHFCAYLYSAQVLEKYRIRFPEGIKVQEDVVFKYVSLTMAQTYQSIDRYIFIYRSNSDSTLHKKIRKSDDNLFLNHVLPAWEWAKQELCRIQSSHRESGINQADITQCDVMKKAYAFDAIVNLCELGFSVEEIKKYIKDYHLESLIKNDLYIDEARKKELNGLIQHPGKMRILFRVRAICRNLLRRFRNNFLIQRIRYPILSESVISNQE